MKRRSLLAGLALASAGCVGRSSPASGTTATETDAKTTAQTDTPTPAPAVQESVEFDPASDSPAVEVRVGEGTPSDRVNPHLVAVWNDGPEREITTRIRGESGEPAVNRSVTLAAGEYAAFRLTEQVAYRVAVGPTDGSLYGFSLPDGTVDCNSSRTAVRVPESGPVEYITSSTLVACD